MKSREAIKLSSFQELSSIERKTHFAEDASSRWADTAGDMTEFGTKQFPTISLKDEACNCEPIERANKTLHVTK